MELDLQTLLGLLCAAALIGWLRPRNSPLPPHLGSNTWTLLVSQDRLHLFVTPWLSQSLYTTKVCVIGLLAIFYTGFRSVCLRNLNRYVNVHSFLGWFFGFLKYFIQHCLICRPSDSTVSEGCWDRTLECCDFGIGSSITSRLDLIRVSILCYETMRSRGGIYFLIWISFHVKDRLVSPPCTSPALLLLSHSYHVHLITRFQKSPSNLQTYRHTLTHPLPMHHIQIGTHLFLLTTRMRKTTIHDKRISKENYAFHGVLWKASLHLAS